MKLEEAVKKNRAKVREAFDFRMLNYAELSKCKLFPTGVLSWNHESIYSKGECIGHFNHDFTEFIKNEHWSDRMRELNGNPIPKCCGFKMNHGGIGVAKKESVAWECSFCGNTIAKENYIQ